jgi:hypothetical protein
MASKPTMEGYNQINADFLENTSLELKIDAMRQILAKFPETKDNKTSRDVIISYLEKYDVQGNLTDEEQHQMMLRINEAKANFIKRRIQ